MEREIKFRCWNEWADRNEMVCFTLDTAMIFENCTTNAKVMEYTGLKDIYNKEIYDGDILNVDKNYSGSYTPTYVLFYKGTFMVQVVHKMNAPFPLADNVGIYEIIGNIYENAELLEY